MAFRQLTEAECGQANALQKLTSHITSDHTFIGSHRQLFQTTSDQLVEQFLQETRALPQTFRMDDLMHEMHEIESQRSVLPPVPASAIKDQLHDVPEGAWAQQYIEDEQNEHDFVSLTNAWNHEIMNVEATTTIENEFDGIDGDSKYVYSKYISECSNIFWVCDTCKECVTLKCIPTGHNATLDCLQKDNDCLNREKDLLTKLLNELENVSQLQKFKIDAYEKQIHELKNKTVNNVKTCDGLSYSQIVKKPVLDESSVLLVKTTDKNNKDDVFKKMSNTVDPAELHFMKFMKTEEDTEVDVGGGKLTESEAEAWTKEYLDNKEDAGTLLARKWAEEHYKTKDDDYNSTFWDQFQEELKKANKLETNAAHPWMDEFNTYYNTTSKEFSGDYFVVFQKIWYFVIHHQTTIRDPATCSEIPLTNSVIKTIDMSTQKKTNKTVHTYFCYRINHRPKLYTQMHTALKLNLESKILLKTSRVASDSQFRHKPTPKSQKTDEQTQLTKEVLAIVNNHSKRPRTADDRFDIVGKNVAMKLRDLTYDQIRLAEKFINNILFESATSELSNFK
nr:unnamed protein product [Callosobruchus chinensis]